MKYIFFGELYHDTIIEANSLDEAYEIIVEKYYDDCICSGSIASVDGTKIIEISAWADISGDDDEDCISYERRPMYLATEYSYRKLSPETIKLLTGD